MTLSQTIQKIYCKERHAQVNGNSFSKVLGLKVPISKDVYEVPMFMMDVWLKAVRNRTILEYEELVAMLQYGETDSYYATLESNLKDLLITSTGSYLVKLKVKNEPDAFYVNKGAIFDKDLYPLMICSYQIRRDTDFEEYKPIAEKPILRLSPNCYRQSNAVTRFLTGKFLKTAVDTDTYCYWANYTINPIHIIVEDFPYQLSIVDTPDITTSSDKLLQVALDYEEEIDI